MTIDYEVREDWAVANGLDPDSPTTHAAYAQAVRFGRPCATCGHGLRPCASTPSGWAHIDRDGLYRYFPHAPEPTR